MARTNKIKYRDSDIKEINKIVKAFNRKITRLEKKGVGSYIPTRITRKEVRAKIETRKDYNRVIASYKRFLRRGSEEKVTTKRGLETTKWQKNEYNIAKAVAQRKMNKRKKEINASEYKGNTRLIEDLNLNINFKDIDDIQIDDFERIFGRIEKKLKENYDYDQMVLYYNNYIKAVKENFSADLARLILKKVESIPVEEFALIYYDDPTLEIDYIYDPLEEDGKALQIIEKLAELGF